MKASIGRRVPAVLSLSFGLCVALAPRVQASPRQASSDAPLAASSSAAKQVFDLAELKLDSWILLPGAYHVAVSDQQLAAGAGVGNELAVRVLVWQGWSLGAELMTLRRSSRSQSLSDTRLSQLTASAARRLQLLEWLELRAQLGAGYANLWFDDAHALTDGLSLRASAILQGRLLEGVWLELSAGALALPLGGNGDTAITLPLTAFVSFGVCARASMMRSAGER